LPITIDLPPPGPGIGPGFWISLVSDFIGPVAAGSRWIVNVSLDPEGANSIAKFFRPYEFNRNFWRLSGTEDQLGGDIVGFHAEPGAPVHVIVELDENGTIIDSGAITATWQPTAQLYGAIKETSAAAGGGFTDADRQQLQLIDSTTSATRSAVTTSVQTSRGAVTMDLGAALRWVSQDLWADHPLTIGPTCDPIDIEVSLNALFGVTLEIDSYPESVVLRTPDGGWSFPDLAVLSFVRNGDLLARHGVHTLSHSVSPLPGCVWIGAFGFNVPIQPTGYHIKVDWLPGVCGHITGQILPVRD